MTVIANHCVQRSRMAAQQYPRGGYASGLNRGFTLVELMIAVTILAIISAVALPAYNQYSQRTYRTEAQGDMLACAQALERRASVQFTYAGAADTDADGVGDADAGAIAASICAPTSVTQNRYTLAVNGTAAGFTLTANPIGAMNGDGFMTLDNAGNRRWDSNNDGDTADAGEDSWTH